MSETKIPGICAKHAVITPACRDGHSDMGAFWEAANRLREEYKSCLVEANKDAKFHLVLTVERK